VTNVNQTGDRRPLLVRAAGVVDARRVDARPGAVLLAEGRVVASGAVEDVGAVAGARIVDLPRELVIPPLVNAHAHLDLSHLGPRPFGGDFATWIDGIRAGRAAGEPELTAAVERGVELALSGGTAFVGDIAGAGSTTPLRVLRASPLRGVSFLEVFGIGRGQPAAVERLRAAAAGDPAGAERGVRLGLQPHAPYSCGPEVYRAALALGRPVATHLAETPEELRFVAHGDGPLADMLRRFGVWDPGAGGGGRHPVDWLLEVIGTAPCLAAHLNYVEPEHLERLADSSISVAYCPRASAYFGHPRDGAPPHRYAEMIEAGVTVALGTDSLVCLDTPGRISVVDEMRLLHRRDGADPRTLLRMATIDGAAALGVDPAEVDLAPGPVAGLLAVPFDAEGDPLRAALAGDAPPRWVVGPTVRADGRAASP
jgi:cytosine/adenosine deaminase-related metal-dependent hydrolase